MSSQPLPAFNPDTSFDLISTVDVSSLALERVLHVHRLVEVEEHARHRAGEEHAHDPHEQQRQPVLRVSGVKGRLRRESKILLQKQKDKKQPILSRI